MIDIFNFFHNIIPKYNFDDFLEI